jgi:uncharacterized protein YndB with AHSA1/START domain
VVEGGDVDRGAPSGPTARVEMLIRRPVATVFRAFTDPDDITRFWLARASGALEPGATVHWEFMVPGASDDTTVVAFEQDRHIVWTWSDGTTVDLAFEPVDDEATILRVAHHGFPGAPAEAAATAVESTQGFTIVVCDLKTWLEHGTSMHLVRDKAALI